MNPVKRKIEERLSPCLEWIFSEPEEVEARVAAAANAGLQQVEFWYWRRRDVPRLAAALEANEVGVSAVVVDPQADIADRETHQSWLKNVEDSAAVAARLGSPVLVATAGGRLRGGPSDTEQLKVVSDALAQAAAIASTHGVRIALEPLNDRVDHPGTLLTSSLTASGIIVHVDSKSLGILFDVYHSHAMGEDVVNIAHSLGPRIFHVQVADDPGRNEPGTGHIDWPAVLAALDDIGYDGSIGLEYKPTMASAESVSFATQALKGNPTTQIGRNE
jgi:hydroxypyruvate isomerase